jgi:hypothetical protein
MARGELGVALDARQGLVGAARREHEQHAVDAGGGIFSSFSSSASRRPK